MSGVKIVFSNVVGGSAVAHQIRELVNQLNNECVLNIGDITVCVDSLDHVKSHDHRSFSDGVDYYELTIHGRVMAVAIALDSASDCRKSTGSDNNCGDL